MEVSLSLTWCRRNAPNYQENDGFLKNCFRLKTMLKVCRWRFLSFFGTTHVTQKLQALIFWKFNSACRYVGETPRIIDKMTDFWRLVSPSIIWSSVTLCDTLITIRENYWLLRLIWRLSESVSEYESVFRMCV